MYNIRIIIPAYRAANSLPVCLNALMRSSVESECEIIIVDDGENGDLNKFLFGSVTILQTKGHQGVSFARNQGAFGFSGQILVFLDADVEVKENAIELLCAPIIEGFAEATVGNYSTNFEGMKMNFAQIYKQLYISRTYSRKKGYIKNEFWTALCAVHKNAFYELGGFRPKYFLLPEEDTELGIRLTESGKRILAVPTAQGKHLKHFNIRKLILNDLRKGTSGFSLLLRRGISFTDNRHTSFRDIVAVIFSYCLVVYPLFHLLFSFSFQYSILFIPLLIFIYLIARSDMLFIFINYGGGFFIKATLLMYFLDIIRGLCVILGVFVAIIGRVINKRKVVF